jgi:hypothetical protein
VCENRSLWCARAPCPAHNPDTHNPDTTWYEEDSSVGSRTKPHPKTGKTSTGTFYTSSHHRRAMTLIGGSETDQLQKFAVGYKFLLYHFSTDAALFLRAYRPG